MVTGVDIWNINSGESVAYEYSRYNYNATDFYQPNPFRASDHDPEVVGLDVATAAAPRRAQHPRPQRLPRPDQRQHGEVGRHGRAAHRGQGGQTPSSSVPVT